MKMKEKYERKQKIDEKDPKKKTNEPPKLATLSWSQKAFGSQPGLRNC